jgi:hypothetical protein
MRRVAIWRVASLMILLLFFKGVKVPVLLIIRFVAKCSVVMACAALVLCSACDESLPSRDEPKTFLVASYSAVSGPVEVRDSMPVGIVGGFTISVRNIYAEVLQDAEFARAEIDVSMRDFPDQRGKAVALRRDLTDQSLVSGGQLTLRPNTNATFRKQWEHATVGGRHFWEFVPAHFVAVPFSNGYWESDSVHLIASGKVQLFMTRAFERLPQIEFTVVYRVWLP